MRSKPKFKKNELVRLKKWDVLKRDGFKLFEDAIIKGSSQLDYLSYEVYQKKLGQDYVVVDAKFSKMYHEFCYTLKFPINVVGNDVLVNDKIPESFLEACEESVDAIPERSINRMNTEGLKETVITPVHESIEKSGNSELFALAEKMQEFLLKLKRESVELTIEGNKIVLSNGELEIKILTPGIMERMGFKNEKSN